MEEGMSFFHQSLVSMPLFRVVLVNGGLWVGLRGSCTEL